MAYLTAFTLVHRPIVSIWRAALLACVIALTGVSAAQAAPAAMHSRAAVSIYARTAMTTYEEGAAMLGSRYLYVGTSSGNALYLYDLRSGHGVRWSLPGLGNGIDYGMERMVLSPDNRWLYIASVVRGDVVALDVTGRQGMRELVYGHIPTALAISRDGRYLYVDSNSGGTDVYDAAAGAKVGSLAPADIVAAGPGGRIYGLSIGRGRADVYTYDERGGGERHLATLSGNPLAERNGSLAVSPDGRRLYVLWAGDSLRALDPRSGRLLGLLRLPVAPDYTGLAVAPNGRQAMLWAPDIAGWYTSPSADPGYILVHFGFAAGGVVPVNLATMRPMAGQLRGIGTPRDVVYSADSRWAFVTQLKELDVLRTGTSGRDTTHLPAVSLRNPGASNAPPAQATPQPGSGQTSPQPSPSPSSGTGGTQACRAWNVSGRWTFTSGPVSVIGNGSGPATLTQTGDTLTGTVANIGGSDWTISGTIQGDTVNLTWSAPGQAPQSDSGTISADGTAISTNAGTFRGKASCSS